MINENSTGNLEDQHFHEYMALGDDFTKIEIYRNAITWYRKALEIKPDNPEAIQKLQECSKNVKTESKAIVYILISAVAIIGALVAILK